ncbi:hypothetical protein CRE_25014 [Caenorhabditis remanei]|uniref:F-box domain-containing protein n=1 Tax=Caenorhabditis remanei TaxID=31234 RepID=E3MHV8_CAERE|nr:hypothetical protein CRE_25014 [Caenorhabditis remanei]
MSTATFPLLRLPENAQRKVLNGFDAIQLINFSLLSKNAKQLAKSLNHAIDKICLYVDDVIFIRIIYDVEYQEGSIVWSLLPPRQIRGRRGTVPIYMPRRVLVVKRLHHGWLFEEIEEYQNPGLSISEWLELFPSGV